MADRDLSGAKRIFFEELTSAYSRSQKAWRRLTEDPSDQESWTALSEIFHRLSGSAGCVGFASLGRIAGLCDGLIMALKAGTFTDATRAIRMVSEGVTEIGETLAAQQRSLQSA